MLDEDEGSGDEEGPPIISKSLANLLNMEGTSSSRSCRSTQTHRKSEIDQVLSGRSRD